MELAPSSWRNRGRSWHTTSPRFVQLAQSTLAAGDWEVPHAPFLKRNSGRDLKGRSVSLNKVIETTINHSFSGYLSMTSLGRANMALAKGCPVSHIWKYTEKSDLLPWISQTPSSRHYQGFC